MESLALASTVMEHLTPMRARGRQIREQSYVVGPGAVPSTHLKVLITWVSIFPLVTLGMSGMALMGPITGSWPTWFRALLLTVIVVPTSAYVIVPQLLSIVSRWMSWRHRRPAGPNQPLGEVRTETSQE